VEGESEQRNAISGSEKSILTVKGRRCALVLPQPPREYTRPPLRLLPPANGHKAFAAALPDQIETIMRETSSILGSFHRTGRPTHCD
jgi:hypothetical protein